MMLRISTFIIKAGSIANSTAQIDDTSCLPPDKKVVKIIEKARLSTDAKIAVDAFLEAINLAPENAMPYYEYGIYAFNKASEYYNRQPNPAMEAGDKSLQKAEELFLEVLEHCSNYHADVFYNLGVINYTQQEMDVSKEWFNKFVNFKSDDPSRYSEDHAKKMADVKEGTNPRAYHTNRTVILE